MKKRTKKNVIKDQQESITSNDNDNNNVQQEEETAETLYLPGKTIEEDEELVYDRKAYNFFYNMEPDWPALSLDCIGFEKQNHTPYESMFISGSQASKNDDNRIYIINMREIKSYNEVSEGSEDEEDSEESLEQIKDTPPLFNYGTIPYNCAINKIRVINNGDNTIAGIFDETGIVSIYKIEEIVKDLKNKKISQHFKYELYPSAILKNHLKEGFAMSWNDSTNELATGDIIGQVYLGPIDGLRTAYTNPEDSTIEDLTWDMERKCLYGAGSSGTVYLWDPRASQSPIKRIDGVSNVDINCIDLDKTMGSLLAVGCDDGRLSIWDIRNDQSHPLSDIKWHQNPISALQWATHEPLMLMVAEDGQQISFWDFYMEKYESEEVDIPDQLLFVHQGQRHTKDARWHPDIPGMVISTGEDGYNFIKPINT